MNHSVLSVYCFYVTLCKYVFSITRPVFEFLESKRSSTGCAWPVMLSDLFCLLALCNRLDWVILRYTLSALSSLSTAAQWDHNVVKTYDITSLKNNFHCVSFFVMRKTIKTVHSVEFLLFIFFKNNKNHVLKDSFWHQPICTLKDISNIAKGTEPRSSYYLFWDTKLISNCLFVNWESWSSKCTFQKQRCPS